MCRVKWEVLFLLVESMLPRILVLLPHMARGNFIMCFVRFCLIHVLIFFMTLTFGCSQFSPIDVAQAEMRAMLVREYGPHAMPEGPTLSSSRPFRHNVQSETHTCGLLAIHAIYRAYNLEPEDYYLRFRLGIDVPAVPFFPDTTGLVHPDALRVLNQDGFDTWMPKLSASNARSQVKNHLNSGHFILALIRRRQTETMHWVVIGAYENDAFKIYDSRRAKPYYEPFDAFFRTRLLSAILVRPKAHHSQPGILSLHLAGVVEMKNAYDRN